MAEDLAVKRGLLATVDQLADQDAILTTNSSSYPSSEIADAVAHPRRLLNMHFLMPPLINSVELMSCGQTDSAVIEALADRLPRYGLVPYRVRAESVGFIFNRIWAAIKREALAVVHEGVAPPEDIDRIWHDVFGSPAGPFRMMDQVGLDVVLDIEEHYARIRDGIPEGPREGSTATMGSPAATTAEPSDWRTPPSSSAFGRCEALERGPACVGTTHPMRSGAGRRGGRADVPAR